MCGLGLSPVGTGPAAADTAQVVALVRVAATAAADTVQIVALAGAAATGVAAG